MLTLEHLSASTVNVKKSGTWSVTAGWSTIVTDRSNTCVPMSASSVENTWIWSVGRLASKVRNASAGERLNSKAPHDEGTVVNREIESSKILLNVVPMEICGSEGNGN